MPLGVLRGAPPMGGAPMGPGGVLETTPPKFAYASTDGERSAALAQIDPGSTAGASNGPAVPFSTRVARVDNVAGIGYSRRLAVRSVVNPPRRVEPRSSLFQPFLVYPLRWNSNFRFGRIGRPRNLGLSFKVAGLRTGEPKNNIATAAIGAPIMNVSPRYTKVVPLKQATARPAMYGPAGPGN